MRRIPDNRRPIVARQARKAGLRNIRQRLQAPARLAARRKFSSTGLPARRDLNRRVSIAAPAVLTLGTSEGAGRIFEFLDTVRYHAITMRKRVSLDLRYCTEIGPEVVLLLAAECDRIKFLCGSGTITGRSPLDMEARGMLHAMGFFEFSKLRDGELAGLQPLFEIASDKTLDGEIPKRIAREFGEALSLDVEQVRRVQTALNEALENSSEHAYMRPEELAYPAESGRWWICASTFPDHRAAYLVACDLGITIQRTIAETAAERGRTTLDSFLAFMRSATRQSQAERLLEAAFEEGVTRREDGRGGWGLGKMRDLLQEFEVGMMTVWSGQASATLRKGSSQVETHHLPCPLPGTYIVWMVKQEASV